MSRNAEVADRLEELADFLSAREVEYKPQIYRTAAANVRDHPAAIEGLAAEGEDAVKEIEGVGDAIAAKIVEYVETGEIAALEEERERMPVDMPALTAVEGLGPKRVKALHDALGITTLDELEAAAAAGEIREVSGFGATTEQNILERIPFARESRERALLSLARPLADDAVAELADADAVERVDVAGSLRRWKATIGDVDVLVASEAPAAAVGAFTDWERVEDVIEAGETKASVRASGLRVDLRVVAPAAFGSALQYFTGSREHNIRLRNHAIDRDLTVNEYGVFDVADVADPDAGRRVGERVAGETEAGVYESLGLPWIPPELREDRGELDAAAADELPDLLAADDLRGDLHVHTDASDGGLSAAEMASAAAERGHDYLAITDHATGPGMVGGVGLDGDALREQAARVRDLDDETDVTLFAGVETNVDAEGDLSTPEDVLADLDLVVASPHSALGQDAETATERLLRAVGHPETDVLGHPTGRLLNQRPGLTVDVERVARAAADAGVALEVNSHPSRLDLDGGAVRTAVEAGATVVVNTDAHGATELGNQVYGVHTARRGWATAGEVLNARDAAGVRTFLE
ncbi:MAG: DNA polymerase/3'-5' exonuclease PolX [Halobacteriaceae archaeon]